MFCDAVSELSLTDLYAQQDWEMCVLPDKGNWHGISIGYEFRVSVACRKVVA